MLSGSDSNPLNPKGQASGNGENQNNGGRRQNRQQQGNQRNRYSNQSNTNASFEEREPLLRGHIFNYTGERTPDQYIKTTKEIINYVGRTYTKYTTEFTEAVQNLKLVDPTPPATPEAGDQIAFEIWKLDIKEYRTKLQEYQNAQDYTTLYWDNAWKRY